MSVNNSFVFIIHKLLRANKYRIDKHELAFQLNSNPFYPSLRAVTGSLKHFVKECSAIELPVSKTVLPQLPNTFIAQIKRAEQKLFVYVENYENKITIEYNSSDKQKLSQESFLEIWTGVIVAIEKNQSVSNKRLYKYKELFIGVLLFLAIDLFINCDAGIFEVIHFSLSLLGVAVCWLIVMYEMGMQSRILDKICVENNEISGCNAIMNSSGAKLFGIIKLSDIGIVYFTSLFLIWMFFVYSHANYTGIVLISGIAIPFTLYSIFYQIWIVKKWCPLCLTVVCILWLQALSITLCKFNTLLFIDLNSILIILFSTVFTLIIWGFVAPRIISENNYHEIRANYYRFKRNYSLFKKIIATNPNVNVKIPGISEIIFGNKNAPLSLFFITSPLCEYCKEVHFMIEKILALVDNNVQITVRFNINMNSANTLSVRICSRLLELYHVSGESKCMEALDDIYGDMLPQKWIQKWGRTENSKFNTILIDEREWCLNNNVDFTPEVFVNGKKFPREYERTDLLFFIESLIENYDSDQINPNFSKEINID